MKKVLIILSLILGIVHAQSLLPEQAKTLQKWMQEEVDKDDPGIAVGVVKDGNIVFEAYNGLAEISTHTPITASTRFNIASNAKQFTALCILKLAGDGKLKLTDDIRTYLPHFFPGIQKPITLIHLLNHSSGVRDISALWAMQGITWWKNTFDNTDALNLLAQQQELNFEPGSQYAYSNSNYVLLAEIVKVVSKKSLDVYADQIFQRLGMLQTSFEPDHKNIDSYAHPYGGWKKWEEYPWLSNIYGDGALFSTLSDQLNWEKIVQNLNSEFLSQDQLKTSQKPLPNSSIQSYGFGIEFGTYREMPYIFHEGSTGAWNASTIRFPSEKLAIVVLSNNANVSPYQFSRKCADLLIPSHKLSKDKHLRRPKVLGTYIAPKDLLGTYRTPGGFFFRFVMERGKLYMERYGRDAIELEHEEGNLYHQVTDHDWKQAFVKDPVKGLQVTGYYPSHDPYTLTRIAADWEDFEFSSLNGSYRNEEISVEFYLQHKKDDRYLLKVRGDSQEAHMYAPDFLLMNGYKIEVVRNSTGKVKELFVSLGRARNLRFTPIEEK